MAKKGSKKAKRGSGCGCSAKGGKLYIVKTPGKTVATKCVGKANRIVDKCRKKHPNNLCTWTPVSGIRKRKASKRRGKK